MVLYAMAFNLHPFVLAKHVLDSFQVGSEL
jgi:hypothetical protein